MSMKWDEYWNNTNTNQMSIYEKIAKFYRRNFFSFEGMFYTDKYFPNEGNLAECGSGTSECSLKIAKKNRRAIAIDICKEPLMKIEAPIINYALQGTIFQLPLKNESLDGIWNFGVMEHFKDDEHIEILSEFRRVLKNGGCVVLFWPFAFGWLHIFFNIRDIFIRMVGRNHKKSLIYPSTPGMLQSRAKAKKILMKAGYDDIKICFSPFAGFVHCVVIGYKRT